ncbi:TraR/DksA C4-type zinc finger protein [Leucobacter aridicollis]|nr:TraR/DksA C4-type zinc finger protein [Leucobacter aridicollis]
MGTERNGARRPLHGGVAVGTAAGTDDDAARAELAEVDGALERWAAGDYGVCESCGRQIPVERLEVRPFATRCVRCASLAR